MRDRVIPFTPIPFNSTVVSNRRFEYLRLRDPLDAYSPRHPLRTSVAS